MRRRCFAFLASSGALIVIFVGGAAGAGSSGPSFTPGALLAPGPKICGFTLAKFDGDDNIDLATASCDSPKITILLGDGAGHFGPAASPPVATGESPGSMVSADFNGDGKTDLALANGGSKRITILLGEGSGGFTVAPGSPVEVGTTPSHLASADLNDDGRVDLAVAGYPYRLAILLGDGSGRFAAGPGSPITIRGQRYLYQVAVADFNRDGKRDLAVTSDDPSRTAILLGDRTGRFHSFTTLRARMLAIADFNRDSKPDIAAATQASALAGMKLRVLLGTGAGRFSAAPGLPRGREYGFSEAAVADFDGDHDLDLALAGFDPTTPVLLGNGKGGLRYAVDSPFPLPASSYGWARVAAADVNRDGQPDLVVSVRRSFQRGGEYGVAILLQTRSVPTSAAGGTFPARGDAAFSTQTPIMRLAADGKRAAVVAKPIKRCGPVRIVVWTAPRRKSTNFNVGCPGDGVTEIAVGGGQVAWMHEGGGNSLELTVTAARLSGGKPKQIDYDGNGDRAGGDPAGGWLGQLLGGGSVLAYNGWTITCDVPDGYSCDEYEPSLTVSKQRLVRIVAGRRQVVKRGRAAYPLAAVGGGRMAVEAAGAVNVVAANGSSVATVPATDENPPRAIALSSSHLALLRTFTLDLYDPGTGSGQASIPLGGAATLQLAGVNSKLALLRGPRRLVVVRLSDGKLISLALRSKRCVDAKLTSVGLFFAYNVKGGARKGRIAFEPTGKLLARF